MKQVTFTLRTLTPLFLAGADQTTAELRAPSFRGLMRYWYRALIGGVVSDLETVKKIETAIFGATDRGSVISVNVSAVSGKPKEFTEQTSVRVGGRWQATGKGYLLWSMAKSGSREKGNLKPARWYFPPEVRFQVTLSVREANAARLEQALAAFWLLTHLGAVGSRSRRCVGSLTVDSIAGNTGDFPFSVPENARALKQHVEKGIAEAKKIAEKAQEIHPSDHSSFDLMSFDVLTKKACRIWILQDEQPWPSAEVAMQKLGEKLQDYRRDISIERRKIFGLPLPPIFRNQRRASPLLLRVVELQEKNTSASRFCSKHLVVMSAGRTIN